MAEDEPVAPESDLRRRRAMPGRWPRVDEPAPEPTQK